MTHHTYPSNFGRIKSQLGLVVHTNSMKPLAAKHDICLPNSKLSPLLMQMHRVPRQFVELASE